MKYYITYLIFLFTILFNSSYCQQNNTWMLGWNASGLTQDNCGIDFSSGLADTFTVIRPMNFSKTNASVCDSVGNLLFYSNGISIANRLHSPLLNESNFNPGYLTNASPNGLPLFDGCIIVSKPNQNGKYFIFHESGDTVNFGLYTYPVPLKLSFSEVDMSLDGGLGGIDASRKNIQIINDTLTSGKLSAVKHANGRDWWVITHKLNSNIFYKILVTPDSVYSTQSQAIGSNYPIVVFGQSAFSPDGKKYVMQSSNTTVELYDFDRCSGLFSNPISILVADSTLVLTGESFSASSRFLYINNNINIRQFDLYSSNISASGQIVGVWDGIVISSRFRTNRLAPDGKIYITPRDGGTTLHFIEFPDSLGLASNVIQNGLITPTPNIYSFPNFPNFNLGADTMSVCDSLFNSVNDRFIEDIRVEVYPNPFSKSITVQSLSPINIELKIYNNLGGLLLKRKFTDKIELDLSFLSSGIYQIELLSKNSFVVKKIVKTD